MSFIDKYIIYYINLDNEPQRRQHTISALDKSIVVGNFERYSAIDGRTLDIDLIDDDIITPYARSEILRKKQHIFGISLTYGSLACALSHKNLWNKSLEQNKTILIFEDDIIIHDSFNQAFEDVDRASIGLDYDIIYMGYNEIPGFKKTPINNVLSKPSGLITGLHCYIVSPSGAYKLLNNIFPLNKQIDSSISDNIDKLNLFCYTNSVVSQNNDFPSRTQRTNGCMNLLDKTDNWYKLFL